jgi:uncharacterized DUF497 family protein
MPPSPFRDPHAVIFTARSSHEVRFATVGRSGSKIILVIHVERGARDRIVSARRADQAERDAYLDG